MQPRYLIQDKVFSMFRHFQNHTVLQPSIGRVVEGKIKIFDGQHKIASLLLAKRKQFECKIYIDADLRLLNQTNIAAHDAYAQTRFYSSVMVLKLGNQFGKDFEDYKNNDPSSIKSESGFMDYLSKIDSTASKGELNKRFRSYLYSSIIEHEDNRLKNLVSRSNRRNEKTPITMDMLEKSFFSTLIYREPTNHNMATDFYKRDSELNNIVSIMNMLYELAMHGWDPTSGQNDDNQLKLSRIVGSKSMMAWAEIFRDALCGKLELMDGEERICPLYRVLSDDNIKSIRLMMERLINWNCWKSPAGDEIDRILADNKSAVKNWFKVHGLTTGYLMGAQE